MPTDLTHIPMAQTVRASGHLGWKALAHKYIFPFTPLQIQAAQGGTFRLETRAGGGWHSICCNANCGGPCGVSRWTMIFICPAAI